jgi:hypothetical protein
VRWDLVRHFAFRRPDGLTAGFLAQSPTGEGCAATFDGLGYVGGDAGGPARRLLDPRPAQKMGRTPHGGALARREACRHTNAKEEQMPKVSKDSAAHVEQHGPVEDRHEDLDGYTVNFVSFAQDIDATPLLKGLPDDSCPCPHWGYVSRVA